VVGALSIAIYAFTIIPKSLLGNLQLVDIDKCTA
jgi:hypothetical protein